MGIRFTCNACSKRLNVKGFLAGKRGICPHCGTKVDIPWQSQDAVAGQEDPSQSIVPQSVGTNPQANGTSHASAATPKPIPVTIPTTAPQAPTPVAQATAAPTTSTPATAPPPPDSPPDPIGEAPSAVWYVRPPSGGQYGPASGEIMRKWVAEGRVSSDSLVWRDGWADWLNAAKVFPELGGDGGTSSVPNPPTAAPQSPMTTPTFTTDAPSPGRSYPRRSNNSLGVVLVVLLTLATLGLLAVLIAVVQFIN